MSTLQIIFVGLFLLVLVGMVVLTVVVKGKRQAGRDELVDLLGGDDAVLAIDEKALCQDTASGEFNEWFGMGSLGIAVDKLVFIRWSPRATLTIDRADVIGHTIVTEFRGKDHKKPILQLSFKNPAYDEGEPPGEDEVAWIVEDLEAFDAALKEPRG